MFPMYPDGLPFTKYTEGTRGTILIKSTKWRIIFQLGVGFLTREFQLELDFFGIDRCQEDESHLFVSHLKAQ